jgi:putative ABC transport system permease protein
MHWLTRDFRFSLRSLRKDRAFTLLAVLALALGIGSVTTIYSVIQNVLLDPFPYKNAGRIYTLQIRDTDRDNDWRGGFRIDELLDYEAATQAFQDMVAAGHEDVLYTHGDGTDFWDGADVTANTFQVLGGRPLLGRGLTPADGRPGSPPVFVMSYKLWARQFNLDPRILGRTFVLNQVARTLVGVMPQRFTWWGADLWIPAALDPADPNIKVRYFNLLGHIKPGVDPQQAAANLDVVARRLAKKYPDLYPKHFRAQLESLADSVVGRFRSTLAVLLGAVGLLLLIACSNVANLLLARATAREKEIAIRVSLGAGRWPIVRQLLIESLLLSVSAAAVGCAFAWGGLKALVAAIPPQTIPDEAVIRLNLPVLLLTLAVSVASAVVFGLAPALHATRRDLADPLKNTGKGVSGGFRHGRLRNLLVIGEVAVSIVLLTGAGLLMRSFMALENVNLGLDPNNILHARLPLPREQYKTAAAKQRFFSDLQQRLSVLPGVVVSSETSDLPPYGGIPSDVDIPGITHSEKWEAQFQLCGEGYFPTLRLKLLRGRTFTTAEVAGARKLAVINQTLARKFFGKTDPLGQRIEVKMLETWPEPVKDPFFEVIGIIADARNRGIQEPPMPELFLPYTITGFAERGILVRTAGDPMLMLNAVRRAIWATDRNVALTMIGTLHDSLRRYSYSGPRFSLILLGVFAGVGLVLVAIGVFSVMAYAVTQQRHEIGLRMALGARPADVLAMVLAMGGRLLGIGVVVGLAASLLATRLLASQIWGVSRYDPVTLIGVVLVLAVAGGAACYFPSRRATRVDPMIVLRYE